MSGSSHQDSMAGFWSSFKNLFLISRDIVNAMDVRGNLCGPLRSPPLPPRL